MTATGHIPLSCVTREQEEQLHPCSKTELAEDPGPGQRRKWLLPLLVPGCKCFSVAAT